MITVLMSVQPLASLTVTVYVFAHFPVIVDVVSPPGAQEYEYGGVPPPAITEAVPLHKPKQLTSVALATPVNGVGCVMLTFALAIQPFRSVTRTLYTPEQSDVIVLVR